MGSMSVWHWLIVLLVVVLVFGTKKLRNIGGDLGGAVKSFKEGMSSVNEAQAEFKESDKIIAGEASEKSAAHS